MYTPGSTNMLCLWSCLYLTGKIRWFSYQGHVTGGLPEGFEVIWSKVHHWVGYENSPYIFCWTSLLRWTGFSFGRMKKIKASQNFECSWLKINTQQRSIKCSYSNLHVPHFWVVCKYPSITNCDQPVNRRVFSFLACLWIPDQQTVSNASCLVLFRSWIV